MWLSWIASRKAAPDLDVAPGGAWFVYAQDDGISVYDATYLDLAVRERLPLASADKQLRTVAKKGWSEVGLRDRRVPAGGRVRISGWTRPAPGDTIEP